MHSIMIFMRVTVPIASSGLVLSIYYCLNRRFQSFLKTLILPAMSSLTAAYDKVASPNLTTVVNLLRSGIMKTFPLTQH